MTYRIGIDLGTTNCALASVLARDDSGTSRMLSIPQQETAHSHGDHPTLPSFLYLPPESDTVWVTGRWARTRSGEVPGRVVGSAKSWLVHHSADRRAKFLPLGSPDISPPDLISPLEALSRLLVSMAQAWDSQHPEAKLSEQEVAITVPASFDPAAQQLTLEAARDAGFPASTILLEEPQAAFYAWMENQPEAFHKLNALPKRSHILVVDIGGGTTDLSLFAVEPRPAAISPHLHRLAVSDHLLLGGDNLDLSLAHFLENRLAPDSQLPVGTFAQLVSRSRDIKEEALSPSASLRTWPVAVARPGASLLAGTLRTDITEVEIHQLLLEGFFPNVTAGEHPFKAVTALREMGLPYAKDPAITRHIADFLRDRPPVDFVLFNGGLTKAPAIRNRILENIARWQDGHQPDTLDNPEPDLAVARGAARFLHLRSLEDDSRIEAGASHSYYIDVGSGKAVCVLPQGAPPEKLHESLVPGLRALVGKPAAFALFRHSRRPNDSAGQITPMDDSGFSELPVIETILKPPLGAKPPKDPAVSVRLRARLTSTGLLHIELLCDEKNLRWDQPWPLQFQLRSLKSRKSSPASASPSSNPSTAAMITLLDGSRRSSQKLTANAVFSAGEKAFTLPKANWSSGMVRSLFDDWLQIAEHRLRTAEHEEAWFQVAGFLLRPGCGMPGDDERVTQLVDILIAPPRWSSGAVKIQRWICARRVAAGLDASQSLAIWQAALGEWKENAAPSAEIALLAGSLESLPIAMRTVIARRLSVAITQNPKNTAFWKALGRLLSRVLLHSGAEQVIPPEIVSECWENLAKLDIEESIRPDASAAWLRAARLTGLRPLDVPKSTRQQINTLLRRWDINEVRRRVLEDVVPIALSEQTALLGESLPPGLTLD